MNLTGKILTLLILLMSIFFFAVALMVSAAHVNWKAEAAAANAKLAQSQRSLNEIKSATNAQKDFIEREKVARAKQIAALTSRVQETSAELAANQEALRESTQTSQARLVTMQEAVARQKQLDRDLEASNQRNAELVEQIGVTNGSLQNKTKENFDQKNEIAALDIQLADLSERVSKLKRVLNNAGLDENSLTSHIVPKLEAVVLGVGNDGKHFEIAAGSDDGVREGHEFDVRRGSDYIGRGVVTGVRNDKATMRTIPGLMRGIIRENDFVTSKL